MPIVQLEPLTQSDLILGNIVLLSSPDQRSPFSLRIIERLDSKMVHLAILCPFVDENAETKEISIKDSLSVLKRVVFETGDRVRFHGKGGVITQTSPNDKHVKVRLEEKPQREIYTNIALLDFNDTFATLAKETL